MPGSKLDRHPPAPHSALRLEDIQTDGVLDRSPMVIDALEIEGRDVLGLVHPLTMNRNGFRRLLLGDQPISRGHRHLFEKSLEQMSPRHRRALLHRVGWVRSPPIFLNNVKVIDNIALPLLYHSSRREDVVHRLAYDLLHRLGVDDDLRRTPPAYDLATLRIASLVRALSVEPRLLVVENVNQVFTERDHQADFLKELRHLTEQGSAVILMATSARDLPPICRDILVITPGGLTVRGTRQSLKNHRDSAVRNLVDDSTGHLTEDKPSSERGD